MKRILFVIPHLRVGGVAKALIELLRNIKDEYDISLLCFDQKGEFFNDIPKNINILPTSHLLEMTERSAADMKQSGIKYSFARYGYTFVAKKISKRISASIWTHRLGKLEGEYDIAISYAHPMPDSMFCNLGGEFVLRCVNAKKRVIFVHCDFLSYGGNSKYNRWLLKQFDEIAAVSESVRKRLCQCVPEAEIKSCVVRNCHDFVSIRMMAEDNPVEYIHQHSFVTAARLSEEKGLLRCVSIFSDLHERGIDVYWTIVGDGPLKDKLKEYINQFRANDYIILAGEHANCYRYIINAKYFLLPSFHEAAPMVYDEAACLGIPIITTDTLSAVEMVEKRNLGLVCPNNEQGIKLGLERAINGEVSIVKVNVNNDEALTEFRQLCEG